MAEQLADSTTVSAAARSFPMMSNRLFIINSFSYVEGQLLTKNYIIEGDTC